MKLLVLTADPKTLLCHRRELLEEFAARGCRITAAASGEGGAAGEFLRSIGGEYVPLSMARSSLNPLRDLRTLRDLGQLFRRVQPDAVFAYTIKSVAYGSLIASRQNVRSIFPLICGLGYAFGSDRTLKQWLASFVSGVFYRAALRRATHVFLQNREDEKLLRDRRILRPSTPSTVVPGSGVDLAAFAFTAPDTAAVAAGRMKFVLVSRLLKSKGVPEFVEAARRLRVLHPGWEFHVVGKPDPGPDGISAARAAAWNNEGVIDYHGEQNDVRPFLREAHACVLPTYYREGVPRSLLEALSSGRPVITTDAVGSREAVRLTTAGQMQRCAGDAVMEGSNGCLIHPRSVEALCAACEFVAARPERLAAMGVQARRLAEERFDVRIVNSLITSRMRLQPATEASHTAHRVPRRDFQTDSSHECPIS